MFRHGSAVIVACGGFNLGCVRFCCTKLTLQAGARSRRRSAPLWSRARSSSTSRTTYCSPTTEMRWVHYAFHMGNAAGNSFSVKTNGGTAALAVASSTFNAGCFSTAPNVFFCTFWPGAGYSIGCVRLPRQRRIRDQGTVTHNFHCQLVVDKLALVGPGIFSISSSSNCFPHLNFINTLAANVGTLGLQNHCSCLTIGNVLNEVCGITAPGGVFLRACSNLFINKNINAGCSPMQLAVNEASPFRRRAPRSQRERDRAAGTLLLPERRLQPGPGKSPGT